MVIQSFQFYDSTTLANFKAYGLAISTAFSTFGWVQAADTGQVNWSTISTVPTATQVFEIWQMGDSLQSTNPVFVRVGYGTANHATWLNVSIQIGSGSNGTGTLINPTTVQTSSGNGFGQTITYECDTAGASNRIHICMFRGSGAPFMFSIERSHDANGNDTGTYATILTVMNSGSSLVQQTLLPAASGAALFAETHGLTFQTTNTSGGFATTVAVTPFFPMVGKVDNPLLGGLCIKSNDFSDGAQIVATMYGTQHTFMSLKSQNALVGSNSTTGNAIAMRFE